MYVLKHSSGDYATKKTAKGIYCSWSIKAAKIFKTEKQALKWSLGSSYYKVVKLIEYENGEICLDGCKYRDI